MLYSTKHLDRKGQFDILEKAFDNDRQSENNGDKTKLSSKSEVDSSFWSIIAIVINLIFKFEINL